MCLALPGLVGPRRSHTPSPLDALPAGSAAGAWVLAVLVTALSQLCRSLQKYSSALIMKTVILAQYQTLPSKFHEELNSHQNMMRFACWLLGFFFYQKESASNEAWQATDEQSECMLAITYYNCSNY